MAQPAYAVVAATQADKLSVLGGASASLKKQKEDAEKLLEDTLKNAEDLLRTSGQAVEGMRRRYVILTAATLCL